MTDIPNWVKNYIEGNHEPELKSHYESKPHYTSIYNRDKSHLNKYKTIIFINPISTNVVDTIENQELRKKSGKAS